MRILLAGAALVAFALAATLWNPAWNPLALTHGTEGARGDDDSATAAGATAGRKASGSRVRSRALGAGLSGSRHRRSAAGGDARAQPGTQVSDVSGTHATARPSRRDGTGARDGTFTGGDQSLAAAGRDAGRGTVDTTTDVSPQDQQKDEDPAASGWLRGSVVTAAGNAAAGARVQYLGPAVTGREQAETTTDRRGEFLLSGLPLPPTTVRVVASLDGQASQPLTCQTRAEPVPGVPWVQLVLQGAGTLTVTVLDSAGQPIAAAKVFAKNAAGLQVHAYASTDAAGTVTLADVPAGALTVLAEKAGYSPPGYATGLAGQRELVLGAGETVQVSLALVETAALAGIVLDNAGRAVENAGVYLKMLTPSGLKSTTYGSPVARTDAAGRFSLTQLPDGRVQLSAVAPGIGVSEWTPVVPGADAGARAVTLRCLPAYVLRGKVVDRRNKPVPTATVTYRLTDPAYAALAGWPAGSLGQDGSFVLTGVPALACQLEAAAPDLGTATVALTPEQVQSGDRITLTLAGTGAPSVTGTVTTPNGAPLTGAAVRLHALGGAPLKSGTTDAAGQFSLAVTGSGPWTVSAAATGLAPTYATVTQETVDTPLALVIGAGTGAAIDLITDLPDALIPAGTEVTVRLTLIAIPYEPFVATRRATLMAATVVNVDGLCPGSYVCEITAPGMSARSFSLTVNAGVGAYQTLPGPVLLTLGATLQGAVATTQGERMPGAIVRVSGQSQPRTTTGTDGSFSLSGVPAGTVVLRADTAELYGLAPPLTVRAGETLNAGTVVLDQQTTGTTTQTYQKVSIGIRWQKGEVLWSVASVDAGSSAGAAQIRAGDNLLAVDGVDAQNWSLERLQNAMSGEAGTSVSLLLARGSQTFPVRLERQVVP